MSKGVLATILSFIAVLLTIAALIFLFYQPPAPAQAAATSAIKALIEQQQQEFSQLSQAIQDDQKANTTKLIAEIEQLSRRLAVLERDVAARPLPGALVKGSELAALKTKLNKQYQNLAQRIHRPRHTGFALLGLGITQLKTAAATGADFSAALNNIAQIMPAAPLLTRLRQFEKGVPSRATLTRQFHIAIPTARQQSASFLTSPFTAIFQRIIKIRPLEEKTGTKPQAVLSQLTARMAEGDLTAALALEPALAQHPTAYTPLTLWFDKAKQRLALDSLIIALDQQIYNLLIENLKKDPKK